MSKSANQALIFSIVGVLAAEFLMRKTPIGEFLK